MSRHLAISDRGFCWISLCRFSWFFRLSAFQHFPSVSHSAHNWRVLVIAIAGTFPFNGVHMIHGPLLRTRTETPDSDSQLRPSAQCTHRSQSASQAASQLARATKNSLNTIGFFSFSFSAALTTWPGTLMMCLFRHLLVDLPLCRGIVQSLGTGLGSGTCTGTAT